MFVAGLSLTSVLCAVFLGCVFLVVSTSAVDDLDRLVSKTSGTFLTPLLSIEEVLQHNNILFHVCIYAKVMDRYMYVFCLVLYNCSVPFQQPTVVFQ